MRIFFPTRDKCSASVSCISRGIEPTWCAGRACEEQRLGLEQGTGATLEVSEAVKAGKEAPVMILGRHHNSLKRDISCLTDLSRVALLAFFREPSSKRVWGVKVAGENRT